MPAPSSHSLVGQLHPIGFKPEPEFVSLGLLNHLCTPQAPLHLTLLRDPGTSRLQLSPNLSPIFKLLLPPIISFNPRVIHLENKILMTLSILWPSRGPFDSMMVWIEVMDKGYEASRHELRKLVVLGMRTNPVGIFLARTWLLVENEADFRIVCAGYWSFCCHKFFLVIPRCLIKAICVDGLPVASG